MFGKAIPLITLFGFPVRMDLSWLFLAVFFAWTLASGFFPEHYPALAPSTYWAMGALAMVGLLVSIVLHEVAHAIVARHYGLRIGAITLFIFGGVAEMTEEPEQPKVEFLMALAGPMSSVMISFGFLFLSAATQAVGGSVPMVGIFDYLGMINLVLAVFNMVPAFPLDGGRVLRAALWHLKKDIQWATRVSSRIGNGFGVMLVVLGIVSIFGGNAMSGVWWILIGLFLRMAAKASYQQMMMRQDLESIPVRELMRTDMVTIPPDISLQDLIERYFYKHYFRLYPVVSSGGELLGCISLEQVRGRPRREWSRLQVADLMKPCATTDVVTPSLNALAALEQIRQNDAAQLMVMDQGQLVGMLSRNDLLHYFSIREELQKAS